MSIFHELRDFYMKVREKNIQSIHNDYKDPYEEYFKNFFINSLKNKKIDAPRDLSVFQNKLDKHKRVKSTKKGISYDNEDDNKNILSQTKTIKFEDLWENIVDSKELSNTRYWGNLTDEEKINNLELFVDNLKDKISEENKIKLKKELINKYESGYLTKNKLVCWNKVQKKIFNINNLIILYDKFYWE